MRRIHGNTPVTIELHTEFCNTTVTGVMKRDREVGPCTFLRMNKMMMASHGN